MNNDMRHYINLIESAEQLDEINFKKAAATAMAVGALAGAPQDAQADNSMSDPQLDKPVATQQVDKPDIKVIKRPDKEFKQQGVKQGLLGADRDQLLKNVKIMHDNRPNDIGKKVGSVDISEADTSLFKQYGPTWTGMTHKVKITYTNGVMLLPLIYTGQKWVMTQPGLVYVVGEEQNPEFDFDEGIKDTLKKTAATAGMIGALAGAPMDTQAGTDAAQGIDTNQPVATQQVEQPREIKYNHKQLKKIAGIGGQGGRGFWGLGMKKDELMTAVKNIHSNKPADIGNKTSALQFGKMIDSGSIQYQNVHIEYENGYLEMVLARGGKLSSFGGLAKTDVGTEPMYIFGNVKFVVGAEIPAEEPPEEFDFE
jgi:hypothetical protein